MTHIFFMHLYVNIYHSTHTYIRDRKYYSANQMNEIMSFFRKMDDLLVIKLSQINQFRETNVTHFLLNAVSSMFFK